MTGGSVSSFTRALVEPTGRSRAGRAIWRVAEPFQYDIGYVGSGLSVVVPAGFETDGPSIPTIICPIVKPGCMVKSAMVHDRLREDLRFSKLESDAVFLAAMQAEGVPVWQRELAFLFVRANRSRKQYNAG